MTEPQRYRIRPDGSSYASSEEASFEETMTSFWEGFMGKDSQPLAHSSVMDTAADKASMIGNLFSMGPASVKRFGQYAGFVPSEVKETYGELDRIPELGPLDKHNREVIDGIFAMGIAGVAGVAGGGLGPNTLNISRKEGLKMLAAGARTLIPEHDMGGFPTGRQAALKELGSIYPDIIKGLKNIPERELAPLDELRLTRYIEDASNPLEVFGRFTDKSHGGKNLIELAAGPLGRVSTTKPGFLPPLGNEALTTLPHEVVHLRHKNAPEGASMTEKARSSKLVQESQGVPYEMRPNEKHPRFFEEEFGRRVRLLGKGERLPAKEYENLFQDTLDAVYARTEIESVGEKLVPFEMDKAIASKQGPIQFERDLQVARKNLLGQEGPAGDYLRELRRTERHALNRIEGTGGVPKKQMDRELSEQALKYYASDEDTNQLLKWLEDPEGPRGEESRGSDAGLKPALYFQGKVFEGKIGQTHIDVYEGTPVGKMLEKSPWLEKDVDAGFTDSSGNFLNRKEAAELIMEDDPGRAFTGGADELHAAEYNADYLDIDALWDAQHGQGPAGRRTSGLGDVLDLPQTSRVPTKGGKLFRPYFRFPQKETSKFSGRTFTHGKVIRRADGKFEIFGRTPEGGWEFLRFSNNPGPRILRRLYKKKR